MRGALVVGIAVAACAKGGAEVIVQPQGMPVDRVVLYAGTGASHGDPIAPAGYLQPLAPDTWWQRDPGNVLDQAAVTGGHAVTFAFTPGERDQLAIVVAVGFQGQTPIGVAEQGPIQVKPDYVSRYTLPLQPFADPLQPAANVPMRLQLWQPPGSTDPAATCVHFEDTQKQKIGMIISDPNDLDCDGLANNDRLECAPDVYRGHLNPPLEQVDCVLPETNTSVPACVLGGPSCIDGMGPTPNACVHSNYCVPKTVCDACAQAPGSTPFQCVTNATRSNATSYSRVECPIQVDMSGQLCNTPLTVFGSAAPFPQPPSCTGEARILTDTGMQPDNQVTLMATLQLSVDNVQPSCSFTFRASGTWPFVAHTAAVLVIGDLDNGRGAGIPVLLSYDPTPSMCDVVSCNYVPQLGDGENECIHAPVY